MSIILSRAGGEGSRAIHDLGGPQGRPNFLVLRGASGAQIIIVVRITIEVFVGFLSIGAYLGLVRLSRKTER